jgi:hypothetical protein
MTIVQQLSNIASASPNDVEPMLRNLPQIALLPSHPRFDGCTSLHSIGKSEEPAHWPNDSCQTRRGAAPELSVPFGSASSSSGVSRLQI